VRVRATRRRKAGEGRFESGGALAGAIVTESLGILTREMLDGGSTAFFWRGPGSWDDYFRLACTGPTPSAQGAALILPKGGENGRRETVRGSWTWIRGSTSPLGNPGGGGPKLFRGSRLRGISPVVAGGDFRAKTAPPRSNDPPRKKPFAISAYTRSVGQPWREKSQARCQSKTGGLGAERVDFRIRRA